MFRFYSPKDVAVPDSHWSHAAEIPGGMRLLHISGQTGVLPDGSTAPTPEGQCEWAWRNLYAIMEEAGLAPDHLVATTSYITGPEHLDAFRAVRERMLEGRRPTSTLLIVTGLVRPDLMVEIEGVAAGPAR